MRFCGRARSSQLLKPALSARKLSALPLPPTLPLPPARRPCDTPVAHLRYQSPRLLAHNHAALVSCPSSQHLGLSPPPTLLHHPGQLLPRAHVNIAGELLIRNQSVSTSCPPESPATGLYFDASPTATQVHRIRGEFSGLWAHSSSFRMQARCGNMQQTCELPPDAVSVAHTMLRPEQVDHILCRDCHDTWLTCMRPLKTLCLYRSLD